MSTDILEGKWHQIKGRVKTQWGELTDDEVDVIEGNYERLVGLIQQKYGKARHEAEREIQDWLSR